MTALPTELRWCEDIGMFAFDRPIPISCVHKTEFCKKTCFNVKLYKFYKNMSVKDVRNEAYWQQISGVEVRRTLDRKRKQVDRVRFMTRGEGLADYNDVDRVADICIENPDSEFWLPTRAWRHPLLFALATDLRSIPNLHVLGSFDPSNTAEEWEQVVAQGWSTMYYGDDKFLTTPLGGKMFKCPKTWGHVSGACGVCKKGCFEGHGRVDVHLKAH